MTNNPFDQQVTFLYVSDLDASAEFYGNILELPLVLDQGSCRIYRVSRDGFVGLCTCSEERRPTPHSLILTLVTNDVDGAYERLKAKGVPFDGPPEEYTAFNIYHCFLHDPDGYKIELQTFLDPDWPGSD